MSVSRARPQSPGSTETLTMSPEPSWPRSVAAHAQAGVRRQAVFPARSKTCRRLLTSALGNRQRGWSRILTKPSYLTANRSRLVLAVKGPLRALDCCGPICQGRSKFGPLRRSKSRPVGEGVAVLWDGWNGACGRPLGRPRRSGGRPTKTGRVAGGSAQRVSPLLLALDQTEAFAVHL